MGAPVEETTIINRCQKENTYEVRFKEGRLPESGKAFAVGEDWDSLFLLLGAPAEHETLVGERDQDQGDGQPHERAKSVQVPSGQAMAPRG